MEQGRRKFSRKPPRLNREKQQSDAVAALYEIVPCLHEQRSAVGREKRAKTRTADCFHGTWRHGEALRYELTQCAYPTPTHTQREKEVFKNCIIAKKRVLKMDKP